MATTKVMAVNDFARTINYVKRFYKTTYVGTVDQNNNGETYGVEYHHGSRLYEENAEQLLKENKEYKKFSLISGVNCNPDTAIEEFKIIKEMFKSPIYGNRVAYHGEQSFKGYEIDPITCHRLGVELAEKMWGDEYQVVVTTHMDTGNIHNHFAINPISIIDGKKYRNSKADIKRFRNLNDIICLENNLSVLDYDNTIKREESFNRLDWLNNTSKNVVKRTSQRTKIREDIDFAISQSFNFSEWQNLMLEMGYTFKFSGKYHSLKPSFSDNNFRFYKLGARYSEAEIIRRIEMNYLEYKEPRNTRLKSKPFKEFIYKKPKLSPLQKRYFRLMYKLGIINTQKRHRLSKADFIALKNLRDIQKENLYFIRNGIKTESEVLAHEKKLKGEIDTLSSERKALYNKKANILFKNLNEPKQLAMLDEKIADINIKLKSIRQRRNIITKRKNRLKTQESLELRQHQQQIVIKKLEKKSQTQSRQNY